jgi:DNA-binding NarL/FixJ family response regulator
MADTSSSEDAASSRPVDGSARAGLTVREYLVLAASATKLSIREIAAEFRDSPEAVCRSLDSAIEKLGARSRLEAVVIALRTGLIDLPRDPAGNDDLGVR